MMNPGRLAPPQSGGTRPAGGASRLPGGERPRLRRRESYRCHAERRALRRALREATIAVIRQHQAMRYRQATVCFYCGRAEPCQHPQRQEPGGTITSRRLRQPWRAFARPAHRGTDTTTRVTALAVNAVTYLAIIGIGLPIVTAMVGALMTGLSAGAVCEWWRRR